MELTDNQHVFNLIQHVKRNPDCQLGAWHVVYNHPKINFSGLSEFEIELADDGFKATATELLLVAEIWKARNETQVEVPTSEIKQGNVKHTLDDNQTLLISYIWEYSKSLTPNQTLEQAELSFMRDQTPDREIAIWLRIIACARKWCELHKQANYHDVLQKFLVVSCDKDKFPRLTDFWNELDNELPNQYVLAWLDT